MFLFSYFISGLCQCDSNKQLNKQHKKQKLKLIADTDINIAFEKKDQKAIYLKQQYQQQQKKTLVLLFN